MVKSYIQSEEEYKGRILKIEMYCLDDSVNYHRRCLVFKNGKGIASCKTKKEAKDLIDHGFLKGQE